MASEALNCNKCGAGLEVDAHTNFATCKYCNARLAIRRTESATFTELMEQVARPLDAMADQLGRIAHAQELERLDREWEIERESYMVTGKHGRRHLPTTTGSVVAGVMIGGFGVVWTVMALGMSAGAGVGFGPGVGASLSCFPLFGVLFTIAGIAISIMSYQKAVSYQSAERRYQERRRSLLDQDRADG